MFWRMTGLSTASPVETILDNETFTLEELLDEDEIIQECKVLNARLINFLQEKKQVEQLIRFIVEEAAEGSERRRSFKFPFVACEIFTCEVDIILKTLVEDEELMNLLFSFLDSHRTHSTLLAGYFSKVVICLLLRKTVPFMEYVKAHQHILTQLVDLIGITSIMEVLIRLIGADEHMYSNHIDAMQWIEDSNILENIVDKFNSSDSPEVHANAAETLCAITRFAPPGLAAKISSSSFIGTLFTHALDQSRPKSVLVNSLSICISLLDPKRLSLGAYHAYSRQLNYGTLVTASAETVEGMLDRIGDLLKLLDDPSGEDCLVTTYGMLHPPLGKHRLKIVEFLSVLLTIGSASAEKELIKLGAVQRMLELFFLYPFNNFLHHHIERILSTFFETKNVALISHLLCDCHLLEKILDAEMNFTLCYDLSKPTRSVEGRAPPRIGNIGHLTRISNKIILLASSNAEIMPLLQQNVDWVDWQSNTLAKRNSVENVYQWVCGRPSVLNDKRDSDDDDYQDRDHDVAALATNLSHAFRYDIYGSGEIDEVHGSHERADEDVYFDDESAEVVISSLRLGDDLERNSLFTNSNWFAFEEDRAANERISLSSSSPDNNGTCTTIRDDDEVRFTADDNITDIATAPLPETSVHIDSVSKDPNDVPTGSSMFTDKPPAWVEWRETPNPNDFSDQYAALLPNGNISGDLKERESTSGAIESMAALPHETPRGGEDDDPSSLGSRVERSSPESSSLDKEMISVDAMVDEVMKEAETA